MTPILLPLLERGVRRSLHKHGVASSFVNTPLGRVHLYDAPGTGSQPTVVLLHGLSASAAAYAPVLARLRRDARRVIAIEFPGHGFSDEPRKTVTPQLLFDSMTSVIDSITGPIVLVGNSLGGAVAAFYALARPDRVAALLLLSPGGAATTDEEWAELQKSFTIRSRSEALAFATRVAHRPRFIVKLIAHELVGAMDRPAVRDILATTDRGHGVADAAAQLATLPMPIVLWWGRSERLLPRSHLDWWRAHLPGHAIIEEPEGIGHCPHVDDPARVAQRIRELVSSRDRSREYRSSSDLRS